LHWSGYDGEQIRGESILEVFPDTRDLALSLYQRVKQGETVIIPRHGERVLGRETWWEGQLSPIPMESGTGILITARAITEQAAFTRDYQLLFDTMLQGVVFQDAQGIILSMNPAAERILGKTGAEIIGQTSVSVEHHCVREDGSPFPGMEHPSMVALRAGREQHDVVMGVFNPRENGYRWISISAVPLFRRGEAKPYQVYTLFDDITERKQAQEALRLRAHVTNTPLAVVEWDSAYRVSSFNARAEVLFGWSADGIVGKDIDEVPWVPEEDRPSLRASMRKLSASERPTTVSASRNVRKDGSVIHCEWYNSALHDASGKLVSLLSLVLDVTERQRAEQALRTSEDQLHAVIEDISEGLILSDLHGELIHLNRAALEMFGIVGLDESRRKLADFARLFELSGVEGTVLRPELWPLARIVRGERLRDVEICVRRIKGDWNRIFSCGGSLVHDAAGRPLVAVLTIADISERRRAEDALRQADRRKNEFLGMLSHELRNPLAPIWNSIYILNHAEPAGEQARHAREVIGRQAGHLGRLVDDLLDVTRIARGKVELRRSRVDLNEIVRRTGEDHRAVLQERGVELAVGLPGEPTWVDGDTTRLAQIVGNFLQNSAKFTGRGGRVTLTVLTGQHKAEIHVRDTGAGIEPDLLEHIFEPFTQGKQSRARTAGGLGLGLALVKGLTELHGGTVRAKSDGPGLGAEFVVKLPVAARTGALHVLPARAGRAQLGRRVLVVDDDRDGAESLAQLVEMFGHHAEVAYDGASAIAKARANPPDVVLCDIGLPGMSGYEVARALRSQAGAGIKLVAVSGYAQPEDLTAAADAGFDRHVAKPPNPEEIERLLT